jgi:competence protein ComGC
MKTRVALIMAMMLVVLPTVVEAAKQVQVTGTVESVNAADNEIKIRRMNEDGEEEQVTLKWEDNLPGVQQLENARVGSQLTVQANQSMGAWEVARVLPESAAGQQSQTSGRAGKGESRNY